MSIKTKAVLAGALVGAVGLTGCATASAGGSSSGSKSISVVGFSVMKTANTKVIADFKKTSAGKGVTFKQSYGASGDQARAVVSGLKADEAHLSLEPDVAKLVDAGKVASDWKSGANAGPDNGILTQSVVVIVVRKGNPLGIKTWDDLTKKGVKIVTPNPGSSGSAKWNILAAYGHVLANGGSEADAQTYLTSFLKNVVALPGSGKDATTAFEGGTGDVLLSYENEAIEARQAGADVDYIVPPQTLLIQNPGVLTKTASSSAKAFLKFQQSTKGQTDYAEQGFRPLEDSIKVTVKGANDPSDPFPAPQTLMTIDKDFGGWTSANTKYFDETDGIVTKALEASGKS
ncbi:sulfate ABC transporter substrate-binding protein [Nocardioides mangrovicus]|uniref:Sulfate ABC transporter substrate-binding protein n=1 Tax=Nocardioides mangrovicus TaxID=2478913 RepID=A0A3L8P5A5_9ACTN|nr:sulfate ABC transporter substrate-binding protein [Nocardioides mangrovicus]RLV50550.1 sulfate ABC transporter substrate-binding protein [Nocardioides mangrovicus]